LSEKWIPEVIIYHYPCTDGFGAAWAAHKALREEAPAVNYVPAGHGTNPNFGWLRDKRIMLVDITFSAKALKDLAEIANGVVILDHHKTAEEDLEEIPRIAAPSSMLAATALEKVPMVAHFDMDRSGAGLAWDYFHGTEPPKLIKLIEDRDLWKFSNPETKAFSTWLSSQPHSFDKFDEIFKDLETNPGHLMGVSDEVHGFYMNHVVANLAEAHRWGWVGADEVPIAYAPKVMASDVAHRLLDMHADAPFAAVICSVSNRVDVSLRSEDHRADVSRIAKAFGGGGHRNAAGFSIPVLNMPIGWL
jgi:oligoribonuclease NrnB/cAMP/cGMP phosphodiesterase (DHH superfamily)